MTDDSKEIKLKNLKEKSQKDKNPNRKQTFMEGVLTIVFAEIVIKILGLLYRVVITNVDGFQDEGNGLYSSGYYVYTLLLAIASIGVPNAIAKLVSERLAQGKHKEAHDVFRAALVLFAMIGLTGSLLLFFGANFIATELIGNENVIGVMKALSPAVFFVTMSAVIRGYFNGMYNMKATSKSQMLEQLFKSTFTIAIVLDIHRLATSNPTTIAQILHISKNNATTAMAVGANFASTLATICSFTYLLIFYRVRKQKIHEDIQNSTGNYEKIKLSKLSKMILSISIPISLASIVAAINRIIDMLTATNCLKILLSNQNFGTVEMIKDEATRLYGILSGKVDMLIGLPQALNIAFATALVPTISNAIAKKDYETAKRRASFSIRLTLLIGLPCAFGLIFLADPILHLLFPNAIAKEAPLLLQLSAASIVFTLCNQTINGSLQGFGKVMTPAIALGCGALLKACINVTLIPRIGIYGAAIGSIFSIATAVAIGATVLRKNIKLDLNKSQVFIKPFILSATMGIMALLIQKALTVTLHRPTVATVIAVIFAMVYYLVGILSLKILDKNDFYMLPYGEKIYHFLQKIKLVKP